MEAFFGQYLSAAFVESAVLGYVTYLTLSSLRGFTLVPVTPLVLAGVPFLPPTPLFVLTLTGIAISSTSIYFASGLFRLDERLERSHPHRIAQVRRALERRQLPIIIGWSFLPFAPTDLICYVCGVMKVDFARFLLGVCVGEGAICAMYIYGADGFLRWLQVR